MQCQSVTRQFIERQFIEGQFIERQFIATTVYRTDSSSNRQFIEPTVYRNESLLNFLKLNTSILNWHMQCVHRILLYHQKRFKCIHAKSLSNFNKPNNSVLNAHTQLFYLILLNPISPAFWITYTMSSTNFVGSINCCSMNCRSTVPEGRTET